MKVQNRPGQFLDGANTQFWLSPGMSRLTMDSKTVLTNPFSPYHHLALGPCRLENAHNIRALRLPYDKGGGGGGKDLLIGVKEQGEMEGSREVGIGLHEGLQRIQEYHDSSLHIDDPWSVSLIALDAKGAPFGLPLRKDGIHMADAEEPLWGGSLFSGQKVIPEIGLGEPLHFEGQFAESLSDDPGYPIDPFFQVGTRIDIDELLQEGEHFRFPLIEALDYFPGVCHGFLLSPFT